MINLRDQLWFRLDVGNIEDVVTQEDVLDLTIIEQLGNNLPCAALSVNFPIEIQEYVSHERVEITILLGYSEDISTKSRWRVAGFKKAGGMLLFLLTLNRDYINVQKKRVFSKQDSVTVIKEVAGEFFGLTKSDGKSSIEVSNFNDKMVWYQKGTAREFIDDVWLHSFKEKALMVPAICSGLYGSGDDKFGTFRLIDLFKDRSGILELRRDEQDGTRDEDGKAIKDLAFMEDHLYSSGSALLNYQLGNIHLTQFDIEKSENVDEPVITDPIFTGVFNASHHADVKADAKVDELSIREFSGPTRFMTDNVHANYHKASKLNLNRLSKFGGFQKILTVADKQEHEIMLGDFIKVHSWIGGSTDLAEIESGDYLVTGVIMKVISAPGSTKSYTKTLLLRRDAIDIMEHKNLFEEIE